MRGEGADLGEDPSPEIVDRPLDPGGDAGADPGLGHLETERDDPGHRAEGRRQAEGLREPEPVREQRGAVEIATSTTPNRYSTLNGPASKA